MSPNIPNYYLQRDFQENLEAKNSISRIFGVDGFSGRFIRIIIIKIFKTNNEKTVLLIAIGFLLTEDGFSTID